MAYLVEAIRAETTAIRAAWQAHGEHEADCALLIDRMGVMSKSLEST